MGFSIMSIRRYAKALLAPVVIVIVVAMAIGLFYSIPTLNKGNDFTYVGPSIKVNGQTLKDAVFNNYLMQAAQQASQYAQMGISYSNAQIRDTAVTLAVRDMAFEQELKKASSKIKVSGADVDKLIKQYLPTEEELQRFMESKGFSSKNEFKKAVLKDIQRQKFIQYKARQLKIKVPKAEVEGMLEQITVSHILVGTKDSANKPLRSDSEALKRANEVYQKVTTGGDFGELSKQYSDDPGSKEKGGTYGPMPLEQFKTSMVKEFVEGSLALKEKQISKPIKTEFGYHVIRLDSRGMPKGNDYKEKYKEIEDNLLIQKAQNEPAFQNWLQKVYQKADSDMEILDPAIRAFRLKSAEKWEEAAQAYQKALAKNYYKNQVDTFVDASDVYLKLKQPKEAIAVLKRAPVALTDTIDYQMALANAYKENSELQKAQDILVKFGEAHAKDLKVHEKLKEIFSGWNATELVTKETQIITNLQKQEQEEMQKYQESLNEKNATTQPADSNPVPSTK